MLTAIAFAVSLLRPVQIDDLDRSIPSEIVGAIVEAVNADEEMPLLGSYIAEARLMAVYALYESRFNPIAVGDHGRALGVWQLQGVDRATAFNPVRAAEIWLRLAHASYSKCSTLPEDRRLAQLTSGSCGHGRVVAERRVRLALLAPPRSTDE